MQLTVNGRLDGTSIKSILTLTETGRTAESVTFNAKITTNLVSSSGYIGGESLYGDVDLTSASGNASKSIVVKKTSESWNSTAVHTVQSSIKVSLRSAASIRFTVKYSLRHPKSGEKITATGSITVPSYAVIPKPPATVKIECEGNKSIATYKRPVKVDWSKSDGATKYHVERLVDGVWTNRGYNSNLTYTDMYGSENKGGAVVQYKVSAVNEAGESAYTYSNILQMRGTDVKVNNLWRKGTLYVKIGDAWKRAVIVHKKVNGTWKKGY